jgi:hypothetical protein
MLSYTIQSKGQISKRIFHVCYVGIKLSAFTQQQAYINEFNRTCLARTVQTREHGERLCKQTLL